ncbi:MAG: NAD(P)-dependent alcohol dehydrogenase [Candidatus Limnocylindrales bacterium]
MQTFGFDRYGGPDVLEFRDSAMPSVRGDQVLVRVRAVAVNPADWRLMRADPHLVRLAKGLRRPRRRIVPGSDIAGVVEAVGPAVGRFRPGDAVFGEIDTGGVAEFASVPESALAPKPANLSFEQAAAVPMAAVTALQALRDRGRIQAGQRVLINGASGGIGTFAVQIARSFGAHVTGVCSARIVDLVSSIGADDVIDYTTQGFATGERRFELVIDMVGDRSLSELRRALVPHGTLVAVGSGAGGWLGPAARMLQAMARSPFVSQRLVGVTGTPRRADLEFITGLIEAGQVTPVIDRTYPLPEAREAIRYATPMAMARRAVVTFPSNPPVASWYTTMTMTRMAVLPRVARMVARTASRSMARRA